MAETAGNRVCSTFGIRLPLLMGALTPRPELGAVMALGAEGIQLGTRLMVTREGAEVFPDYIAKLVFAADDTSTMSPTGATRPRSLEAFAKNDR